MEATRNTFSEFLEFRLSEIVAKNIRYYVKKSQKNTQELSYASNLSLATINRLKNGEHLSIQGICALAEALSVDPLEFFKEA